tara:strand:- start:10343 stop:10753 length:411 start_codon:yes stop_codon:yes gene_type:complete
MSELIKVEASELEGAALDWAVAKSRGGEYKPFQFACNEDAPLHDAWVFPGGSASTSYRPSTNWAQGGPLIAEKVTVTVDTENGCYADCGAQAHAVKHQKPLDEYDGSGPTILIACMRAIVSSELGPKVEVPKELVT